MKKNPLRGRREPRERNNKMYYRPVGHVFSQLLRANQINLLSYLIEYLTPQLDFYLFLEIVIYPHFTFILLSLLPSFITRL